MLSIHDKRRVRIITELGDAALKTGDSGRFMDLSLSMADLAACGDGDPSYLLDLSRRYHRLRTHCAERQRWPGLTTVAS